VNERGITESVVEQAALAWLESASWDVAHGPRIAPDPSAEVPGEAFLRFTHIEGPPCTTLADDQPKSQLAICRTANWQSAETLPLRTLWEGP